MKDISSKIKRFLFCIMLGLLLIPLIQSKFGFVKLASLQGAISKPNKTYINIKDWFSGDYQLQEEKYLNATFGFRNLFIRLHNQLAFSLFNVAKANGVIIGKNNYLFEENYIKAYYGSDFIGIDSITNRMQKLKYVSDTLSKLNKTVIVVFAAGKGSFYPEFFPKKFISVKSQTNYGLYLKLANEYRLNYIDFHKYFIEHKTTSKYPLYPQYGIHWSHYGMCIAADSIIKYIEKKRNIDMPNLFWNKIEMADAKESDYDIANGMNLCFKLKTFKMAYPVLQFQNDSGKIKPNVLVVSDSYYWGMYNFGIARTFSNNHFWFYNKQVYPEYFQNGLETSQINLKDEIEKHDVFIIMATEATLPGFGWGFIENTYDLFKGIKKQPAFDSIFNKKLINLRNYIKTDRNWLSHIEKKAIINKISVDSMITLDAIWQLQHNK